jgi:hypothetical protein
MRDYRSDPMERPDRRKRTLNELRGLDLQEACFRKLLDAAMGDTTASDPILPPSTGAQPEGLMPEPGEPEADTAPISFNDRTWPGDDVVIPVDMGDDE